MTKQPTKRGQEAMPAKPKQSPQSVSIGYADEKAELKRRLKNKAVK